MGFSRTEAWKGLTAGDPVRIAGLRGRRWRFRCHVENVTTGATWVEVAELDLPRGVPRRPGEAELEPPVRRIRSFAEDRIVPLQRRRRGRLDPPPGQGTFDLGLPAPGPPAERVRRPARARARREAAPEGVEALRLALFAGDDGPAADGVAPGQPTR